ncbi:hypothetical protein FKW77_006770 [Venturia effusa]|uniref:Uncharacterized protein n=1 Tax=Venturia effusa TaxID=50376 RepID=A0A517LLV6_9PEZI|nr:hypothetical protein FKW77_006770 [Venturia effusa]
MASSPIPHHVAACTWNLPEVLHFQPSAICCGTSPKGDHCTSKLYPYTSDSVPGKSPEGMQEEVLQQLVATNFRSSAKTKELLHKLTGLSLCTEHRRQQDRFERRWMKDIEMEKARKKKEDERRRLRAQREREDEDESPESPSPLNRGVSHRVSRPGTRPTRMNFDRLASRGPKIAPPFFGTRQSIPHPPATAHLNVPSVPALPTLGAFQLPTPRMTPDICEPHSTLGSNRREPPVSNTNPLMQSQRKYSSKRSSPGLSDANPIKIATKIPRPNPASRNIITGLVEQRFGSLPLTPESPAASLFPASEVRGTLRSEEMEEIRTLQRVIAAYQEKISRDQGRIFEILMGRV